MILMLFTYTIVESDLQMKGWVCSELSDMLQSYIDIDVDQN